MVSPEQPRDHRDDGDGVGDRSRSGNQSHLGAQSLELERAPDQRTVAGRCSLVDFFV
jgi:hypothetical protein